MTRLKLAAAHVPPEFLPVQAGTPSTFTPDEALALAERRFSGSEHLPRVREFWEG